MAAGTVTESGGVWRRIWRWWGRCAPRVPVATLLALALTVALVHERREAARYLLLFLLVWIPVAVVVYLPRLVRRWRQILLLLGTLAALWGLLELLGPAVIGALALPMYNLDIDHRPKPATGRFNRDGVAPDVPPEQYTDDHRVLLFLGDSFTQGYGLEDPLGGFPFLVEQRLATRGADPSIRVVNFGWVSSSPVLQLRQLRDIGGSYRPDVVVQCFDMTDFADDLRYGDELGRMGLDTRVDLSPFRLAGIGLSWSLGVPDIAGWLREAVGMAPAPSMDPGHHALGDFFAMRQSLEQSRPALRASWQAILDTATLARSLGAEYALVVLPRYQQYDLRECPDDWEAPMNLPDPGEYLHEPFRFFEEQTEVADFPVWSLLPAFQEAAAFPTVFRHDPHYNPTGHAIAADAIAENLWASGWVDP